MCDLQFTTEPKNAVSATARPGTHSNQSDTARARRHYTAASHQTCGDPQQHGACISSCTMWPNSNGKAFCVFQSSAQLVTWRLLHRLVSFKKIILWFDGLNSMTACLYSSGHSHRPCHWGCPAHTQVSAPKSSQIQYGSSKRACAASWQANQSATGASGVRFVCVLVYQQSTQQNHLKFTVLHPHPKTEALGLIWRQEGLPGFYRGILPGLLGVSHGALQFMAYEEMKKWVMHRDAYASHRQEMVRSFPAPPPRFSIIESGVF